MGIVLGLSLAFLIEYVDNTLKTPDEIEEFLALPSLGVLDLMQTLVLHNRPQTLLWTGLFLCLVGCRGESDEKALGAAEGDCARFEQESVRVNALIDELLDMLTAAGAILIVAAGALTSTRATRSAESALIPGGRPPYWQCSRPDSGTRAHPRQPVAEEEIADAHPTRPSYSCSTVCFR